MNVATETQVTPALAEPAQGTPPLALQVVQEARPRLFTADEFHQMVRAGVFGEDERLELLEGVVVAMTTQGPAHAQAIRRLTKWLILQIGDAYSLLPQLPVTLGKRNEPVPDLSVVRADEGSNRAHPTSALLVIEVADTTLRKDRGVKAALYARCGIAEYWIVNVQSGEVEVHRDPDPAAGRYRTLITAGKETVLTPTHVPGVTISVDQLFA